MLTGLRKKFPHSRTLEKNERITVDKKGEGTYKLLEVLVKAVGS